MNVGEDAWLSGICEKPVFRVSAGADAAEAVRAHAGGRTGFYYAKVDAADVATVRALSQIGFFVTDVNVTFAAAPSAIHGATSDVEVGPIQPADKEAVLAIAHDSFRFTRFHLDPLVPKSIADRVKREWIRNYADGKRGDALLVARSRGEAVGFLAVLKLEDRAIIDLVAVGPNAQRRGAGRAMILAFAEKYRDVEELVVGTQVSNVPSIRMYESMGFRLKSSQYVLHMHVDAGRAL